MNRGRPHREGKAPGLRAAARAMVATDRVVEPDPANAEIYDDLFERCVALYHELNDRP